MSKIACLLCVAAAILLPPSAGMSQQAVRWEPTLENAERVAGQTNRLVLIHFCAPWCGVCKRMEAEILSQPGVAAAVNANYVAVKINADYFPATARQYGVTALPTTVIVSPQGEMLATKTGYVGADEYVGRLNQVAVDVKHRKEAAALAQIPTGNASPRATQPPATQRGVFQPAAMVQAPPMGQPSYAAPAASTQTLPTSQAQPSGVSPVYGQAFRPATPPSTVADQPRPPVVSQPTYTLQQQPMNTQPPLGPAQGNPAAPPAVAGNPPLALDGYCAVSLCENQRWVMGDRRWGITHRGRTYLFAGPEEQRRFFADPDRYAPMVSGNDIVLATEQGQAVPGMREHGVFFENRVYLFSSEASLEKFARNPNVYANHALEALRAGSCRPGQQWR